MQTQTPVNAERLLETFLTLVRIDSPSGQEAAVRAHLETRFKTLGFTGQADAYGNLIVQVPGNRANTDDTVIFTGHMDVVPPCIGINPVVEGDGDACWIRSSGDTVLGADDKSGLAAMLEALEISIQADLPRPNLLFLITTREEVMLQGAKDMDPSTYQHAKFAVALDHTGQQGTIIYEAPSYIKFTITVTGKSVHAGIMPEQGINAIQILSWVLEKIKFGRLDENTTKNLGFIKGGKATNIVPDYAMAQGELRGHDPARMQVEVDHIRKVLADVVGTFPGAGYTFDHEVCFEHYQTSLQDPWVQKVVAATESLGLEPNLIRTNGGSDVNIFAKNGVPGIVLSAGYVEPHSLTERVPLKDMVTCTQLLLAIWEAFAQ